MKRKTLNTHLTLEGRLFIENSLNEGRTVTEISNDLKKTKSTITREVSKHITRVFPSSFNNSHPCLNHDTCKVKSYECHLTCKMIKTNPCKRLVQSPHVCNNCTHKNGCRHVKLYYKAQEANSEYLNSWKEDREGMHYTEEELIILNTDFRNLVLKNKSIYHSLIIINNRGYNFKIGTIYKQIEKRKLTILQSDLPRNRKVRITQLIDNSYKRNIEGATYEDYLEFKKSNPQALELQMDTVEGIKENNAPVILTLQIVKIHFLMMFKIDSQTNEKVIEKLLLLRNIISLEIFNKITEIVLTDNGKEFIKKELFKNNFEEMNIFYCHPYASFEKGNIENNHELIRRVIPKGISLSCYSQKDYDILCSHINSLFRKDLDGKCPFDLVDEYIPQEYFSNLNLKRIKPEDVTLIPELFGEKNINNIRKYLDEKEIEKANIKFLDNREETVKNG